MSRDQRPAQHAFHYNEAQRIPRRRSATDEDLQARQTRGAVVTSPQHGDEDADTRRSVGVIGKSAIRHRPIGNRYVIPFTDGSEMHVTEHELGTLPENYQNAAHLITSHVTVPRQKRQPHPKGPGEDETVDEMLPARTPAGDTDALPQQKRRRFPRFHWLFWVGLALFMMLAGYILLNMVANWWQVTQDDWRYGRPRTFQIDANVGHGTAQTPTSHFIALNLNRHIEVIEIPGNDPSKSKTYIGPGEELVPVTLSFEDVNHDGRPDLVIHVGDSKVLFLNQPDATFKAAPNQ